MRTATLILVLLTIAAAASADETKDGAATRPTIPAGPAKADAEAFSYYYCFQSWCPGCHKAGFPTLKKVAEKYKDDDGVRFVVFQTVFEDRADKPVNTFENLKKIAAKHKLTMPFAQSGGPEDKSSLMRAYKTRGTPWMIILDSKGVIRHSDFRIRSDQAVELIDRLKLEAGKSEGGGSRSAPPHCRRAI